MKAAASNNHGYAVVRFTVIVNDRKEPVMWSEPKCVRIEPRNAAMDTFMDVIEELCSAD